MSSPLLTFRKSSGQTLDDLAAAFGVDRTTVWRWETGKVPVSRLGDIERLTGVPRQVLRPDIFGDAQ